MAEDRIRIVTDASFISANRPAGIAAVYVDEHENPRLCCAKTVNVIDNLNGELNAILYGLEAIPMEGTSVTLYNDNRDAIEILNSNGMYRNKSYQDVVRKIRNVISVKNLDVKFKWRGREKQKVADAASWQMAFSPEKEKILYPKDFF